MQVLVTGASGFVGHHLVDALLKKNYEVLAVGRHAPYHKVDFYEWDLNTAMLPVNTLRGVKAVIHLAGENIFGRWTYAKRRRIRLSRIKTTQHLVESIRQAKIKPRTFISASAVGYYGNKKDRLIDESAKSGRDFLAQVCRKWEAEAKRLDSVGVRTIQMRTAPVLGESGMLATLLPFFQWGLGGTLGNGKQWAPWIHIHDLVQAYLFALEHKSLEGPVNAVAPGLITNRMFTKALAHAAHKPALFRVPNFALKLRYGKLADSMMVSQKVEPAKLVEAGFEFRYGTIRKALRNLA